MKVSINGIGAVGGFGCGIHDLRDCLEKGSGPLPSFIKAGDSEAFYPAYRADTSSLTTFVPKRALRRIDHFSQIALTSACLALKDAGLDSPGKHCTGLVICSGYGSAKTTFSFLDSLMDYGDACASPTLFSNSVHNAAAGHISIMLGLDGPCLTVSQFEMSVPSGLLSAIQWLKEERVEQVLLGAVEEYCDVLGYCYQRYYGMNENVKMTPFKPDQESAVPGEGAVFFLLSKEKSAAGSYCNIDSVNVGRAGDKNLFSPDASLYILNGDGHKECDKKYSEIVPHGSLVSCYTPFFGSMPIGTAFDMAVGALSLREDRLYPSLESIGYLENQKVLRESGLKAVKNISCVKIGRNGESSTVTISNSR